MPYKNFSDFLNIELKFGDPKQGLNFGYTAIPNFDCLSHKMFSNEFFLLYRRSEYAAQVELACAEIFKYLMGYGLEMEIVKNGNEFFIASRRIKNFSEGCGNFEEKEESAPINGLMSIFVIWYFIGQTDTNYGNYGFANIEGEQVAFGLDMAEALDFKMLARPIKISSFKKIPYIVEKYFDGFSEEKLPTSFVTSTVFQREKLTMIKKIANTPFEVFENILRKTIKSDYLSHHTVMLHKSLALIEDESTRQIFIAQFNQLSNSKDYSLDALIHLLRVRHEQIKQLIKNPEGVFSQDLSLAAHSSFLKELNKYHGEDSNDDSDLDNDPVELSVSPYAFFSKNEDKSLTSQEKSIPKGASFLKTQVIECQDIHQVFVEEGTSKYFPEVQLEIFKVQLKNNKNQILGQMSYAIYSDHLEILELEKLDESLRYVGTALVEWALTKSYELGKDGDIQLTSAYGSYIFWYSLGFRSKDEAENKVIENLIETRKKEVQQGQRLTQIKDDELPFAFMCLTEEAKDKLTKQFSIPVNSTRLSSSPNSKGMPYR